MNSLVIAKNLVRRVTKERSTLAFLIVFPILAAILSSALNTDDTYNEAMVIGVANMSLAETELTESLIALSKYQIVEISEPELMERVEDGSFQAGLIGTADSDVPTLLAQKENAKLQELQGLLTAYYSGGVLPQPSANDSFEELTSEINASRMTAGFLTMLILFFMGTGMGMILEDKRDKTLMRIYSAPVKGYQVVFGNLLANIVMGSIQILLFFLVTKYVVRIEWGVPIWQLFVIASAFMITAIGLGIGLTGILKNQQQFGVVNNIVAVVTCLLGGAFFPPSMLSGWLEKVSNLCPQKWFMSAFDELSAGGTIAAVQTNLFILLLFGAVFLTFGIKALTPRAENL